MVAFSSCPSDGAPTVESSSSDAVVRRRGDPTLEGSEGHKTAVPA